MTEEQVTKALLRWLMYYSWQIVCFDFPQSGTGRLLHPNGSNEKIKDSINPDIVAVKGNVCLFFENKDRYYYPDYEKQNNLIEDNNYTEAIDKLLKDYTIKYIYYGIGLPTNKFVKDAVKKQNLVDFIVGVDDSGSPRFLFNPKSISI